MGQLEPAVKLLVECDPEEENFLADQHLACLISTVAATGRSAQMSLDDNSISKDFLRQPHF